MRQDLECPECGSEDTYEVAGCEGVLRCVSCGEFFEDDFLDLPTRMKNKYREEDEDDI